MAGYINALIPLFIGILFIAGSKSFVKPDDVDYIRKTSLLRKCGWVLAGVGVLLVFVEYFSHR